MLHFPFLNLNTLQTDLILINHSSLDIHLSEYTFICLHTANISFTKKVLLLPLPTATLNTMMRLPPVEPHDAAEEEKKMREIVISNFLTFFVAVGVIRLVPHVIKLLSE